MINVLWVATLFCWSMIFKRAHYVGHVAQVLRLWNLHVAHAIPGSHPGSSVEDVGVKNCGINQLGKHHCKPKSPGHANPLFAMFFGCVSFQEFPPFPTYLLATPITLMFLFYVQCGEINMWQRNLQQRRLHRTENESSSTAQIFQLSFDDYVHVSDKS